MDVVSLDSTGEGSLFVLDETPMTEEGTLAADEPMEIMGEVTNKAHPTSNRKRKMSKKKKKNLGNKKGTKVINGGTIEDSSPRPARRKKRKTNSIETIVIDDDDDNDDSVVELSNDEDVIVIPDDDKKVGVIGGLLERSFTYNKIQRKLNEFQILRERNKKKKQIEEKKQPDKNRRVFEPYHCPKPPGPSTRQPSKPRKLRPIIIDGSNVAFGHGDRTVFSTKGIAICRDYFKKRGHTVKVFIPQFRRRHPATSDTHILDKLEEEKVIVFTPSRKVNGKTIMSYDDRMMVEYAAQSGGVIVTRDNLQDLVNENETFREVINERLLMFTWVDEDIIMFPQDPLGRTGPKLDEFLSFPDETSDKEETDTANKSES